MKKTLALLLLCALPAFANAAETGEPVEEVMKIAVDRWDMQGMTPDYFEAESLDRDFSRKFIEAYQAASQHPAYDDGSSNPFDYDVITDSQDGCPLEDVKVVAPDARHAVATFKLWSCAEDGSTDKNALSEVRFDIVMENGKSVIDDINRFRDGKWASLMEEMQLIAKGQ